MDKTDFSDFLKHLEKVANCPICLQIVSPPMILCENGHGMCHKCGSTLDKCSVCQQKLLTKPPKMLEQLLEALPKPCEYASKGCKERSYNNSHDKYCKYHVIKCPLAKYTSCTWSRELHKVSSHLKDYCHKNPSILTSGEKLMVHRNTFMFSYGTAKPATDTILIKDQVLLIFRQMNEENELVHTLRHVPTSKPIYSYHVILSFKHFETNTLLFTIPLMAVLWNENERLEDCTDAVRIPVDGLKRIIGSDTPFTVEADVVEKPYFS